MRFKDDKWWKASRLSEACYKLLNNKSVLIYGLRVTELFKNGDTGALIRDLKNIG